MLNLDPAKLLIIAVVAVILLGPDKLPQVARQVGAAWRSFSEFRHRMESEVRSSIPDLPSSADIARLARSPSALLNHLSNMDAGRAEDDGRPPRHRRSPNGSMPGRADIGRTAPSVDRPSTVTSADTARDESPLTGVADRATRYRDPGPDPVPTPCPRSAQLAGTRPIPASTDRSEIRVLPIHRAAPGRSPRPTT